MRAAAKRQSDRTRKERPARQRARHQPMRAVSPHRVIPHPALSPSVIAKESGAAVSVRPGPRCRQRLTAGQGAREKEKREKINLKNQVESLIYQAEKQLGELGDQGGCRRTRPRWKVSPPASRPPSRRTTPMGSRPPWNNSSRPSMPPVLRVLAGRCRWCSRRRSRRRQRQWRFRRRQLRR